MEKNPGSKGYEVCSSTVNGILTACRNPVLTDSPVAHVCQDLRGTESTTNTIIHLVQWSVMLAIASPRVSGSSPAQL